MTPPDAASRARALALVGAALLGACSPPVQLSVVLPDGVAFGDVTLHASVYAPAAAIQCDDIAFGVVPREALLSSQVVADTVLAASGDLGDVPRDVQKLVLVEGLDASDTAVVEGCALIPPVKARAVRVEVDCVRTADAAFAAPDAVLIADELVPGVTSQAALRDSATDAALGSITVLLAQGDAPVDGFVRVFVVDASGAETDVAGSPFAVAAGQVTLDPVDVRAPGPFALHARARFARGPDPAPLRGLGVYANAALTAAELADALDVVPAAVGVLAGAPAPAAFLLPRPGNALTDDVTIAVVQPGAPGSAVAVDVATRTYRPRVGAAQPVLGTALDGNGVGRVLLDTAQDAVCGGVANCLVAFASPGVLDVGIVTDTFNLRPLAVPAGPCGGTDGTVAILDGGALALADLSPPALAASGFAGDPVPLNGVHLLASVCVVDDAGAAHRMIKADVALGAVSSPFLFDADGGALVGQSVGGAVVQLPALVDGEALAVRPDTGELLVPVAAQGAFEIDAYGIDDAGKLAFHRVEVPSVPFPPAAVVAGHFTRNDAVTIAVLAVPPGADAGTRPRSLLLLASPSTSTILPTGALPVDCKAALQCHLLAADVDGDGIDEVLLGSTDAADGKHAAVLRFGP